MVKVENFLCPRCGAFFNGFTALSRRDNKTNICSPCGTDEAMFDLNIHLFEDGKEKEILIEKEVKWLKHE
ncbi:hypothetical protein LCGC14_0603240 [marine sediment metagenome]|uniref:Uncharacterized protein n=1 Tax=marine sediment metagenome TaxID=412755 RepID=A0A0F9RER5_9ZZZZ